MLGPTTYVSAVRIVLEPVLSDVPEYYLSVYEASCRSLMYSATSTFGSEVRCSVVERYLQVHRK